MEPIRVMVVDDEQLVRVGLRSTVDWEGCGMRIVADAPNGEKAWEMFLSCRPEVVITDIVMPLMDGLELAHKIREEEPSTQILFLSCHRDFDYARQGIQLGAAGYIVKTSFDDDEMNRNLMRIRRTVEAERSRLAVQGTAVESRWLSNLAEPVPSSLINALAPLFADGARPVAYLLFSVPAEDEWLRQAASEAAGLYVRNGSLAFAVVPANCRSFEVRLGAWKRQYSKGQWLRTAPVASPREIQPAMRRLVRLQRIAEQRGIPVTDCAPAIQEALLLIHDAVDRPIGAGDVALQAHLSRAHFSVQFKKETGYKVQSYILLLKLQRAKELLAGTAWKTNEIAEAVGMSDSKHFSKWFKKSTGLTPSDYREQTKTP